MYINKLKNSKYENIDFLQYSSFYYQSYNIVAILRFY